MDPAALNPSKELRENLIDATQELIDLWLESQDYKSQRAIERRLQRLVTGLPWLLGSLYPWEQEFLLLDLGLHPPPAFPSEQPVAVSERDALASPDSGTLFSGAIQSGMRDSLCRLPTFVVTDPSQVGVYKPSVKPKDCVSAAPSEPGLYCHSPAQFCVQPLAPQSVAQPFASHSVAQPLASLGAQLPVLPATQPPSPLASLQPTFQSMAQSRSSFAPLREAMPVHPLKDCFSTAVSEQGDKLFQNGPVPLKLTTLETVTRSRASPEAGLQPSANSGPLEAKLPAVDCTRLSLPEQGQGSVQLQPSSCVPEAHVPTGFVSRVPEAHKPAGFVLCVPGASMPTGFEPVFAGGTEEPIQLSPFPAAPPSPAPTPPPAAPPSPALTPPPSPALKPPPAAPPSSASTPPPPAAPPSPAPTPPPAAPPSPALTPPPSPALKPPPAAPPSSASTPRPPAAPPSPALTPPPPAAPPSPALTPPPPAAPPSPALTPPPPAAPPSPALTPPPPAAPPSPALTPPPPSSAAHSPTASTPPPAAPSSQASSLAAASSSSPAAPAAPSPPAPAAPSPPAPAAPSPIIIIFSLIHVWSGLRVCIVAWPGLRVCIVAWPGLRVCIVAWPGLLIGFIILACCFSCSILIIACCFSFSLAWPGLCRWMVVIADVDALLNKVVAATAFRVAGLRTSVAATAFRVDGLQITVAATAFRVAGLLNCPVLAFCVVGPQAGHLNYVSVSAPL
ncbi:proline-rich protein 36-like [Oreochromis niloticus]|uniref:proline-rich protein 36-like n=1 Tax=Oreochromis niloticus TaxID=8128 RepID=UPI00090556AF|nr:proline-rich protein 36-like [Oreochromis niloticus]